jgi:hypothetical protein
MKRIKEYLTTKNLIIAGIILGLVIALFQVDSCRNDKFKSQQNTIDSLTLANQKLIQDTNKLGQIVSKQTTIITQDQEALKALTANLFNLMKIDEKRIKQIDALIQIKSRIRVDSVHVPFKDEIAQKQFSDSVNKACREVIDYYSSLSIMVPQNVQITEEQNKDFQFDGTITKQGLMINSLNLPDSQRIAIIETKGGFFKRDINRKVKFYTPKKLEIQVLHTNKYIKIEGMSSVIYQPKKGGRWLERALIFGVGAAATILITK